MKLNLVPPRTGIQWVKLGIRTFWRQPLALAGLFFVYLAAVSLLSLLPYVGTVLALAITPAATLGLMAATQEAVRGRFPMPGVLVSAFRAGRERLRAMAQLGLIYAAGALLVMGIVALLVPAPEAGAAAAGAAASAPPSSTPGSPPPAPEISSAMLLTLLLHAPLAIAFWFAPALVHWHGVSPVKSLFFSVVAVMRNFWAFTVYGLVWMGVIVAASLVMNAIAVALGTTTFAAALMMPVALLLAAMFFTSIYFTFVDCFSAPADGANTSDLPSGPMTP